MPNSGHSSNSYFEKLQNYPSEGSRSQNTMLTKATCERQPTGHGQKLPEGCPWAAELPGDVWSR